jgi:hypothetical protein
MDDCHFEQHQKIEKKTLLGVSLFFNWPKFRQKEKLEKIKKEGKDVILRVFNNQTSEK